MQAQALGRRPRTSLIVQFLTMRLVATGVSIACALVLVSGTDTLRGQRGDDVDLGFKITPPLPAPNPQNNPYTNSNHIPIGCKTQPDNTFFSQVLGTWSGTTGQNFISLPQAGQPLQFMVEVNSYAENITYELVGGGVLQRGIENGVFGDKEAYQTNQVLKGIHYYLQVYDHDLKTFIHKENGMYLYKSCMPERDSNEADWHVMRMGSVPHGTQPMAFGTSTHQEALGQSDYVQFLLGVKSSYRFSVQPSLEGCGPIWEQQRNQSIGTFDDPVPLTPLGPHPECCIKDSNYMLQQQPEDDFKCPRTGCPEPIDLLIDAVKDLTVSHYHVLNMSSGGVPGGGGMQNTRFVNHFAEAQSESFSFMIVLLDVVTEGEEPYQLIQYIQTVELKFVKKIAHCPMFSWPHVQANTLRRLGHGANGAVYI